MTTQETQPKTLEQTIDNVKTNIGLLETELGFIEENSLVSIKESLEQIKNFMDSELAKNYFIQGVDYLEIFDSQVAGFVDSAKEARAEKAKGFFDTNIFIGGMKEKLGVLLDYIKVAQSSN